ncbi:hypothetical protein M409DRAFT_15963 [Zasmidium cellare ATCC 36951]|uniref:Enoyl reductase (ER) domain-containing protein n=1 Tax=Zasmidium cellare ATCC 36951 TaxID=1080233 RepID=A0A6A6D5J8_ZASCE|nr:uncharacterized protein M409DRAFT_15963 [Zasmidium cellare ATCC 36951]KAF2173688.1 hypothetical protein M409DRAFT_15963 [Zasmidium cellare ATCC 36951]
MKEGVVTLGPKISVREVSVPVPGPEDVLIRVAVTGTNPKDWKMAEWGFGERNEGDDMAGVVEKVGTDVVGFRPGDRVGALHRLRQNYGTFAEFSLAPAHCVFRLPPKTTFEEAATIPLAAMTAAVGLFARLRLPQPFSSSTAPREPQPLLIYGAAGAVGLYTTKLAVHAGFHPLICVAGAGASAVEPWLDSFKGDVIVDYRKGDQAVVEAIRAAIPEGLSLKHAFDCVSANGTYLNCEKVLDKGGKLTMLLRIKDHTFRPDLKITDTKVGSVQDDRTYGPRGYKDPDDTEFGRVWFMLFTQGLKHGWLKGHPYEVIPGGFDGIEQALVKLKSHSASATKFVVRMADI